MSQRSIVRAGSWTEKRIATSAVDGVVVRLCEPVQGEFPCELAGCETTHQVGLWTSDVHRPHGTFRYGPYSNCAPIGRVAYVPADISWVANIEGRIRVKSGLFCDFEPAFFRKITGIETDDSPHHLNACLSVTTPALHQALWMMLDEVKNPGFSHEIAVDALSRMILLEVGRYFHHRQGNDTASSTGRLAGWQLNRVRSFVEEVEERPVTIGELAALCGVSASHFRRVFKATTGETISGYIDRLRMDRARTMLTDKTIPLKQIAFRLGFANPSAFSNAFRRAAGMTPLSYRQMTFG